MSAMNKWNLRLKTQKIYINTQQEMKCLGINLTTHVENILEK